MRASTLVRYLVGESNFGRLEYLLNPKLKQVWAGPFNGQQYRRRIFLELLRRFPIQAIVETGTFRGTTTALFADTSLPVYSVESHPRYFAYSQMRFRRLRGQVHLHQGDSRAYLRLLARQDSVPHSDVFFYLDAHWEEDLPLREEVQIIFSHWTRAVIMIDDFQVPNLDYAFDDYGPGRVLNMGYLDPVAAPFGVSAFFPAADCTQETGAKRGTVVLCREPEVAERMGGLQTLVRYPDPGTTGLRRCG
jgi:hypothetical protein